MSFVHALRNLPTSPTFQYSTIRMSSSTAPKNNEHNQSEHKKKSTLRSSELDLKVILKYPSEESDEILLDKEYSMYSQVLAYQSRFVDAALTVDMQEKETRTISLQCSSPEVFEKALLYLEDYRAAREATVEDVVQVVEFYNMYEFVGGLSFADDKLSHFLPILQAEFLKSGRLSQLVLLVDLIALTSRLGLVASEKAGVACINISFRKQTALVTEEVLQVLQPFLCKHYDSVKMPPGVAVSREEVATILFPKYFCKAVLIGDPTSIYLHDTGADDMDGQYFLLDKQHGIWGPPIVDDRDKTHGLSSQFARGLRVAKFGDWLCKIYIRRMTSREMQRWKPTVNGRGGRQQAEEEDADEEDGVICGDWAIHADALDHPDPSSFLWRALDSAHLSLPPQRGWVCVDQSYGINVTVKPEIGYISGRVPVAS